MRTKTLFLTTAAVLAAASSHAGYSELNREWEGYEPPAQYRAQPAAAPVVSSIEKPSDEKPSSSDAEFQAQIDQLRQAKELWEAELKSPAPEDLFLTPDPARVEALRAASTDVAAAEKTLSEGFSMETLEILALLRNPGVQAKERELRAALASYGQVENLDSILRRYSIITASLMTGVGSMENPDVLTAKFPFPGVLALKGQIVNQDARAVREELEAARRDAVTSVRKAYWELLYVGKAREITARMLDLMENLKGAASARYEAGETSFQDVIRIGIEREKIKEELNTMAEDGRNMEAMIRETLNLPPTAAVGAPAAREYVGEPAGEAVPEEGLFPLAREKRQELRTMRAMIGKMERMLEMSESMIYPGMSLGLSTFERKEVSRVGAGSTMAEETGSFPTTTSAGMGEGLPKMPWYGKDDAYMAEIRQRIEALKKDLEMTEAATLLGVHQSWFALDKARREASLYGERVVTLSHAALEAATQGYSVGKVMFSDLIESYTGWLNANLSAERARADIGVARAELEAAVGTAKLPN